MVSASVLGAAAGTGLALVIAVTIVLYKYYAVRRKNMGWPTLNRPYGGTSTSSTAVNTSVCLPSQKDFNILKEHQCQVQPKRFDAIMRGIVGAVQSQPAAQLHQLPPTPNATLSAALSSTSAAYSPPLSSFLTSHDIPLRRASTCSVQIPRLLSVDEERSSPLSERRGSAIFRCVSPLIRAISPEGSPSLVSDESPPPFFRSSLEGAVSGFGMGASSGFRPPLTPSRSLSVEVPSCSSPEPRSPLRATSPDLRSTSPSPELRPLSPRGNRPLSPLLIPKSPTGSDCATNVSSGAISPIGTIQPDLYKKKDAILVDSQGTSGVPNLGRLHFRLKYDFHRSDLIVHIIEAHDLSSSENGGFNDPYVKVSMVPAVDTKCRQTKIQRKCANPYFNETFKFPVALDELAEKYLLLQVFDFDKFSRNDVVGEIRLLMNEVDVTSDVEVWSEIRKNKKPPGETQELLFSLSYLPSAERLTVVLLKARNLIPPSTGDLLNPYVKVYMLQDGRRLKKKKSSTRRSCNNPVWNEAVAFNVAQSMLSRTSLELRLQNNDQTVGLCTVGPKVEGLGEVHWSDMVQNSRKSVAMWHPIKGKHTDYAELKIF